MSVPAAWSVVELAGELDLERAPDVRRRVLASIEHRPGRVVIDAERLTFVDSSVLGTLVRLLRDLRADGGDLRIAGCTRSVARVLSITGLDQVITVTPTIAEAVAPGSPRPGDAAAARED